MPVLVMKHLLPSRTQPPASVAFAVVVIAATSLPASRSVIAMAAIAVPARTRSRHSARCSAASASSIGA